MEKNKSVYFILFIFVFLFSVISCEHKTETKLDAIEAMMFKRPKKALREIYSMDVTSLCNERDTALYDLLYTQARYTNFLSISDDSMLRHATAYFNKENDLHHWAWTHYYRGCKFLEQDCYGESIQEMLLLEKELPLIGETLLSERIYNHLGYLYVVNDFYEKAELYSLKAIFTGYNIKDSLLIADALGTFCRARLYSGDTKIKQYLWQAIKLSKNAPNNITLTNLYYTLSDVYFREYNKDSTLYYALLAKEVNQDSIMDYSICNMIGVAYSERGEIDSARYYMHKAAQCPRVGVKRVAYMCLSDIETALGNSQKALEYERLYSAYQDSVEAQSQRVDIKNAEKAVALMQTKENNKREKKTYFYVIIVLFFVAIVITVIACRRIKNHRALIRNTEEKLKFITKQLQTVSDKLRTKTDLLEIMKCQTEEYGINAGRIEQLQKEIINLNAQRHAIISEIAANSTIYQKLSRIIAQGHAKGESIERMEDSDWLELVSFTNRLYNDLILKLRREYGFTEADIRFCSLVLADFNLNELAFVLFRTPSAIHKRAKYILQTKLGFTDALPSNLRDALLSIKPTPSLNQ